MNAMRKVKQLFIGTKRDNEILYIAKPSEDKSSIIIQREIMAYNAETNIRAPREHQAIAIIIEGNNNVHTVVKTAAKEFHVECRIPSTEFTKDESNIPEKYKGCCIECSTLQNNILRAYVDNYNAEADVFNSLIITLEKDGVELLVAEANIYEQNELQMTAYGYLAKA